MRTFADALADLALSTRAMANQLASALAPAVLRVEFEFQRILVRQLESEPWWRFVRLRWSLRSARRWTSVYPPIRSSRNSVADVVADAGPRASATTASPPKGGRRRPVARDASPEARGVAQQSNATTGETTADGAIGSQRLTVDQPKRLDQ